jgi:hypothetical protein
MKKGGFDKSSPYMNQALKKIFESKRMQNIYGADQSNLNRKY